MKKKHVAKKSLKYTTLNRYFKKRNSNREAISSINAVAVLNHLLPYSVLLKEKRCEKTFLNKKMLKKLIIYEPISFGFLNVVLNTR